MKRTPLQRKTPMRRTGWTRKALPGTYQTAAVGCQRARKKPGPEAKRRAKKRRLHMKVAAVDRTKVFRRQSGVCYARDVSPVCTGVVQDPHELIPVGRGGKRVSSNRVGVCRVCHDEAQGRVGGNRLIFEWPGQDEGQPPNADEPGNVTARWRDRA